MNVRREWTPALLGMALLLGGCSALLDLDGDFARDASPGDTGVEDTGPDGADSSTEPGPFADLPQLTVDGSPADYGCLGMPTAPPTGAQRTFTLVFEDFQTGARVPNLCVNVYPDNNVPASDTCSGVVTDEEGEVEVTTNGGWFAYRLFPTVDTMGVVQRNVMSGEAGASVGGNSVSTTAANLLAGILGRQRDEGSAAFAGTVYDCNGAPVQGAGIRVTRGGSVVAEGPGVHDPMYAYFSEGNLPDGNQPHTNSNGLFIALNIPVIQQGEVSQLIGCGKVDGQSVEVIGAEESPTFADTYSILSLHPRRSDGPTPAYDCQ
jgi:hypothetical protein